MEIHCKSLQQMRIDCLQLTEIDRKRVYSRYDEIANDTCDVTIRQT